MGVERVLADLEDWIKADPRWARFQQGRGRGWDIRFREMEADEAIDWHNKIMWLAMWRWPDPKTRAAHLAGHVIEHFGAPEFTYEMCAQADEFAAFWMTVTADGHIPPLLAA